MSKDTIDPISVEYTLTGWTVLSCIFNGLRYHHKYDSEYTLGEAKTDFRKYVLAEDAKIFRNIDP